MSGKVSVISLSLALVLLFFSGCSDADISVYADVLSRPFCADVSVVNLETEYNATVTLHDRVKNEQTGEYMLRDGEVLYTSPESLSDISATRYKGTVTVGVGGVVLTPSEKVGQRYSAIIDTLDLGAHEMLDWQKVTVSDRVVRRIRYLHQDNEVILFVDDETKLPISLECGAMKLSFGKFVYIT